MLNKTVKWHIRLWTIISLAVLVLSLPILFTMNIAGNSMEIRHVFMIGCIVLMILANILIIYFARNVAVHPKLRRYLIQMGVSALGIILFAVLHNAIISQFGEEPFTFVMAMFVCPISYLIGCVRVSRVWREAWS